MNRGQERWQSIVIRPELSILEAVRVIDKGALRLALVTDDAGHLQGVVTDGDVRRALLKRVDMKEPVMNIMNPAPTFARASDTRERMLTMMHAKRIEHLPILNEAGCVTGLETMHNLSAPESRENWVVLMAGGLGSRLSPLTDVIPKPLLKVGSKPILEVILESFISHGFYRFFLSVNYRKEMIKEYFGDGSAWGVQIVYLEENGRLGTAGSLSLFPERPKEPFFVMNGDLLTRIHFQHVLNFHLEHQSRATLCVRKVEQTVPYGVVRLDAHRLVTIEEKPVQEYFVNAGIYLLDPEVLPLIPKDQYFDMPTLFQSIIKQGETTAAFPFLDYWMDIGRMGDFRQACRDYPEVFAA
ncbi:MAG: nucleotidyltransferase family protein [Magnetococcales bacterium]|nr:nucleotidyltransferase family protein [Magnetococcales bacterium]